MSAQAAVHRAVRTRFRREQTAIAALVVGYIVAGRLGLAVGFGHEAIGLVWPASGIALGALLVLGYRLWPVIALSALVLYASALGPDPAVLGLAAGSTIEGLLAAYLVNRYAGGRYALQSPRNCLWFAGVVSLAVMITSAVLNPFSLIASDLAPAASYGQLWLVQVIGSGAGGLLVTPLALQLSQGPHVRPRRAQAVEGAAALVALLLVSVVVFFRVPTGLPGFPSELLCLPLLLWVALRLGRRMASAALLVLASTAVAGTWSTGPASVSAPALGVTLFLIVAAVMTLLMAALAAEYTEAEAQLRELVVTDPLTGLPNYRRLVEVMGDEIAVADRTGRTFAVVFFDMDGLKRVNDECGHLVGSRAVCRFAEVLRAACRTTDTPARYGGDEFVAVLPDADEEGARLVVRRAVLQLDGDTDRPKLSVSAGIAVYPRDGGTPTTLLSAADRALYVAKAGKAARGGTVEALEELTSAS